MLGPQGVLLVCSSELLQRLSRNGAIALSWEMLKSLILWVERKPCFTLCWKTVFTCLVCLLDLAQTPEPLFALYVCGLLGKQVLPGAVLKNEWGQVCGACL